MSEVFAFRGGPVSEGQFKPPQCVIDLLEEVLADARAGKLVAVGIVTVSPTHFVGKCHAMGEGEAAHDLVAGAVYLLDHCKSLVLGCDH